MQKKKVLILHGQPGMGHLMPAKALIEVFSDKYPEIEIKDIDTFMFFSYILKNKYSPFYNFIVLKTPVVFKFLYDSYKYKSARAFYEWITLFLTKKSKFVSFVKDFSPDFILATNPVPLQLLSLIKKKEVINIVSANICTDFGFHSAWYDPNINYYFVANDLLKESFIRLGVDSKVVMTTGIPVAQKYNQLLDRQKILSDLHFSDSRPIFLIVGGQLSYRELLKVISGIKNKNSRVQFIVVAGRDKHLQNKIKKLELKKDPNIKVFNFIDNLQDYMMVADLILSKAGGSTVAECLVMGLPMIFSRIIPGQEEDNVNYIIDNGAGVKAVGVKEIIETVVSLFNDSEKLAEMSENCKKIAKPNAAADIVDFVVSKMK